MVVLPFLSRPLQSILTFTAIAPRLFRGINTLFTPGSKVDALDATAVGVAAVRGDYVTANAVSFLLTLGEYLEDTTERQSDRLLKQLLRPVPTQAWVDRDGTLRQIPCSDLREGDQVVVGIGELIPIDGRIIEGMALVNQASLTGESLPVTKEPGERVLSGTVVEEGRITIWAERVGDKTTTARITRFIEESLQNRPATQRLADLYAERRVYLTLGMGALVLALTGDIRRLAAVLMVDYSCAIKLSLPIAFKASMHRAAPMGRWSRADEPSKTWPVSIPWCLIKPAR
jgi:P-type E1-E2 ATPase